MQIRYLLFLFTLSTSISPGQVAFHSELKSSAGLGRRVERIAFSGDGRWLAAGTVDGDVQIAGIPSGSFRSVSRVRGRVTGLAFSSSAKTLVVASQSGTIQILTPDEPAGNREMQSKSRIRCISLAPNDSLLAVATENNIVSLWSTTTGQFLYSLPSDSKSSFISLGFPPDRNSLVAVTSSGQVWEWNTATRAILANFQSPYKEVHAATVGNRSPTLAFSTTSAEMFSHPLDRGAAGPGPTSGFNTGAPGGMMSSAGGRADPRDLIRHNRISVYDLSKGKIVRELDGLDGEISSLSISADDRYVAAIRQQITTSSVDVITVRQGVQVQKTPLNADGTAIAFSPDARWMASAEGNIGTVKVYEVRGVLRGLGPGPLDEQIVITSKETEPLIPPSKAVRIAIMDFDASLEDPGLGRTMADMVRNRISGVAGIEIMDRQEWGRIIGEQNIQLSDRIDAATAVRLGAGHGVQKLLFGRVSKLETTYTVSVRMVDVETTREDGVREVICQSCTQKDLPETIKVFRAALVSD